MALVSRDDANVSIDASTAQIAPQLSGGLIAGEALDAGAPCYIAADGQVYMSNGTAADIAAHVDGFCPAPRVAGEAVTLYGPGTRFRYGTAMTPGDNLYLEVTAGRLGDAATVGGTSVIARAISATEIVVMAKQ